MTFLDLAERRYATKAYTPNQKISDEKITQLKNILRLSPSSINSQPWKFTFVSDEKVKSDFAAVSYTNLAKINQASHLVIFSAVDDIEAFEGQIKERLPEGAIKYYNNFVRSKGPSGIKSWIQHQVYLSLGFFLSACASLEIDSTPMEGIHHQEYDRILKLDGYTTAFAVAIGYRSTEDQNQPSVKPKTRLTLEDIIHTL